jgi:predicted nucleotidyltransferase
MDKPIPTKVNVFLQDMAKWAADRADVAAVLLVGSFASGDAGPDSDVDLVIITEEKREFIEDWDWAREFGPAEGISWEDWGKIRSLRVHFKNGLEVEFGLASTDWLTTPFDSGTSEVLLSGVAIVFDQDRIAVEALQQNGIQYWQVSGSGDA